MIGQCNRLGGKQQSKSRYMIRRDCCALPCTARPSPDALADETTRRRICGPLPQTQPSDEFHSDLLLRNPCGRKKKEVGPFHRLDQRVSRQSDGWKTGSLCCSREVTIWQTASVVRDKAVVRARRMPLLANKRLTAFVRHGQTLGPGVPRPWRVASSSALPEMACYQTLCPGRSTDRVSIVIWLSVSRGTLSPR